MVNIKVSIYKCAYRYFVMVSHLPVHVDMEPHFSFMAIGVGEAATVVARESTPSGEGVSLVETRRSVVGVLGGVKPGYCPSIAPPWDESS